MREGRGCHHVFTIGALPLVVGIEGREMTDFCKLLLTYGRRAIPMKDKFEQFFVKTKGCWFWIGESASGYGRFNFVDESWQRGSRRAHILSYEIYRGAIPEGTQIRHLCENKLCVNPDHLRAVSYAELAAENLANRFWSKVNKTETCWFWRGTVLGNGYGQFWYDGRGQLS